MSRRCAVPGLDRAAAIMAGLLLAACTTTAPVSSDVLRNPRSIALTCQTATGPQPIAACTGSAGVRAYVSGGSIGSIAVANPAASTFVDTDPAVPGFSTKMIGDLPQALVADPRQGGALYFALGLLPRLGRLRLPDLVIDWLDIPFVPANLAAADTGSETVLWASDPQGRAVWRLPVSAFDGGGAPLRLDIEGSPFALAVHSDGRVFVGHVEHDHVTVLSPQGAVLQRVSLGPACANGIDDDGDGDTDHLDSGCDDDADDDERAAELAGACTNAVDDDGDGLTDGDDPGCAAPSQGAAPRADACRNGIDDDGDGFTDFPIDFGCISYAGASEAVDAAACGDGIDNDGDGATDFPADPKCPSASSAVELPPTDASAKGPCNNGVDDDGDGATDFPSDADCAGPTAAGELRLPCADGIDNDGDGAKDLQDNACRHRGSPSEVGGADAPNAVLALSEDGAHLVIGHRARNALQVLDTKALKLIAPVVGAQTPFLRSSRLDAREGLVGLSLPNAPLAMAPIGLDGRPALAVTLAMTGLVYLQLSGAKDPATGVSSPQIALREAQATPKTTASKPTLEVGGKIIDTGSVAPSRYANPGTLDSDNAQRYFGLVPTQDVADHRSEQWRIIYQGRIPGSLRHTGRLRAPTLLVDASADFCRMGVVEGDLLLLHRAADAPACPGLPPGTTRWKVSKVQRDRLALDPTSGRVDVPVTADNQVSLTAAGPASGAAVPTLSPACFVDGGLDFELRANGWLVLGSRTGLLSSRPAAGAGCRAIDAGDPLSAARIVEPTPKPGATAVACPITADDLKERMEQRPYAGGAPGPYAAFANAVFSLELRPGCAASDVPGAAPTLLPSIRDASWRYFVVAGVQPRVINVGAAAVAIASAPALGLLYVVDQGAGVLAVVDVASAAITAVLD